MARSIGEVEALRPLWEEGVRAGTATIFQNLDWNLLALRTFRDERACFVACESDSSLAILPTVVRNGALGLTGGPLFDYRDAVCAGNSSAFHAALETVARWNLPFSVAGVLERTAGTRWPALATQHWTAAPFVSAKDMSAESFALEHARGRRALRRLCEMGATVRKIGATPELMDELYREKAKEPSVHGTNVFRDDRCIKFMAAVVAVPSTRCEVFLLEIGSDRLAALVTFIDGHVRRFYTTWMNPAWGKHSPGIALLFEATRQTLEDGLDCDYMTGEQPYKLRFATGSEPLCKIEATAEQLAESRHHDLEHVELKAA